MKATKILSAVLVLIGLGIGIWTVRLCADNLNSEPILRSTPEAASAQAEAMMEAVASGDYTTAGQMMYGNPDLGVSRIPESEVGALMWNAFVDSLTYEFQGDYYATNSGIARNVSVTALDIPGIMSTLNGRSTQLLEERVAQTADISEIYDDNNEYREDFVMDVLYDAATQALQDSPATVTMDAVISLVYHQGQWWVVPDAKLLGAITGGIAG